MNIPDTLPAGQYVIYALVDPTDELVYYVGQTHNPKERLGAHLAERYHKGKKGDWLRRLKQQGQQPLMLLLEFVMGEAAALACEREWKQHFIEEKMPLLNAQAQPRPVVQALIPLRQKTILLCGYPVIIVELLNDHTAASLRSLCHMLQMDLPGQIRRIRRDRTLADQLLPVVLQTPGGPQAGYALIDWAVPLWAAGLQTAHMTEEKQALALRVKQEAAAAIGHALTRP